MSRSVTPPLLGKTYIGTRETDRLSTLGRRLHKTMAPLSQILSQISMPRGPRMSDIREKFGPPSRTTARPMALRIFVLIFGRDEHFAQAGFGRPRKLGATVFEQSI
jgi:hypothetical protein